MELFFSSFTHLTWWIIGVVLLVFEIFTGGTFLLWLGVAAIAVGGLMFAGVPLNWQLQLILFSLIAILSIILWRRVQKKRRAEGVDSGSPHLSRRGEQYIGKEFELVKAVKNGVGKVRVDDTLWRAKSDTDIVKGTKVKVTAVDGASLIVESSNES